MESRLIFFSLHPPRFSGAGRAVGTTVQPRFAPFEIYSTYLPGSMPVRYTVAQTYCRALLSGRHTCFEAREGNIMKETENWKERERDEQKQMRQRRLNPPVRLSVGRLDHEALGVSASTTIFVNTLVVAAKVQIRASKTKMKEKRDDEEKEKIEHKYQSFTRLASTTRCSFWLVSFT